MGVQTYFVAIASNGRYMGMERALVEENFEKIRVAMTRDEARRILGKPTESVYYKLADEDVWSWRYEGHDTRIMFFNAHLDPASGRIRRMTRIEDWKTQGGP